MSFFTTNAQDYGSIDFGCRGYGGLLFSDKPSTSAYQTPVIVQQNLAYFWDRRGLIPRTAGFPVPIFEIFHKSHGKTPVDFTTEQPREFTLNRNCLAGELVKGSKNLIRLWAVNDVSDRKVLNEYTLEIKKPNAKRYKLINLNVSDDIPIIARRFSACVYELRSFRSENSEGLFFSRTAIGLFLCDPQNSKILFKSPVRCFFQAPYIEDEIVLIDDKEMLWWGELGQSFSRIKTSFGVKAISPTDHPRVILGTDGTVVHFLDLREDNRSKAPSTLISIPSTVEERYPYLEIDPTNRNYNLLVPKDSICHMSCLFEKPHMCMVTSERHHILVDERMPGTKLLEMGHAQFRGGDYYLSAPPFKDPIEGGLIYSYFGLSHTIRPSLTQWSVYLHDDMSVWSSLCPSYAIKQPVSIATFTKNHLGLRELDTKCLPKSTRAIHYQRLPETSSHHDSRAFLFRAMDNGELWFDNIIFAPDYELDSDARVSYRNQALKSIHSYLDSKEPQLPRKMEIGSKLCSVSFDLNCLQIPDTKSRFFHHPLAIIGRVKPTHSEISELPELVHEIDEKYAMSNCILKMWKKTYNYFSGKITEPIEYRYKNATLIGKWTVGIRQVRNVNQVFDKMDEAFNRPRCIQSISMLKSKDMQDQLNISDDEPMDVDQPSTSQAGPSMSTTEFLLSQIKREPTSSQVGLSKKARQDPSDFLFKEEVSFDNLEHLEPEIEEEGEYDFDVDLD